MAKLKSNGLSITTVTILVLIVVLYFGWGFLAASYVGGTSNAAVDQELDSDAESDVITSPSFRTRRMTRGRLVSTGIVGAVLGVMMFIQTTVTQLPNLPSVLIWNATHRLWLLILVLLVPLLVIAGGFGMKQVEQQLDGPPKVKKRKMALPRDE